MPATFESDRSSYSEDANSNSETRSTGRSGLHAQADGRRRSLSMPRIGPKASIETLPGHISVERAPYAPQVYPSVFRRSPKSTDDNRDARKSNSTANFSPHKNIDIRYDPLPLVRPAIHDGRDLPKKSVVTVTHGSNYEKVGDKSPFNDPERQNRLREVIYGRDAAVKDASIYDWTVFIDWQTRMDVNLTDHYLTHLGLLGDFLESRPVGEDGHISDFIRTLRGTPGWPHPWNMDEVDNAWQLLWLFLLIPADVPINRNCKTFQSQTRALYPPTPAQSTQRPFSVTLSGIVKAGLTIKATTYAHEHFKVLDDDNTVYIRGMNPGTANSANCYPYNRAARSLGLTTLYAEVISSIFVVIEQDEFNWKAEELGILEYDGPDGYFTYRNVFKQNKDTPPKLFAGRALYLENLIRRRQSFWTTLRRDLRKQRKEQPFAFWGSILALFFGICTVIQTVTSVWALVATLHANNLQALQGTSMDGLKVSNTPWTSCISKDDPHAMLKDEVAMSCLFRIDFA
ncbi:hypothetical protein BD410DRAFT_794030 [Rickenella mellea]|uniref:Transmembrane protein n=1 Tax=Rickenella mellea TaxID=50990 RepID=A0A4Y7PT78_9AGAM|nr:hypothetical protein BD410DRAFT_794030 [Rickenella mellea]